MTELKIFSAEAAAEPTKQAIERFRASRPDTGCTAEFGGSTGGIKKLLDGREYDVMILADVSDIERMMMPDYADGYYIWAASSIVAAGEDLTPDKRKEKLTDQLSETDLSDPAQRALYQSNGSTADGGAEARGTTVLHGIVIPRNTKNKALAEQFAREFLSTRFTAFGFSPVRKKVGEWTALPENMWDREAARYNMMTLMEVRGTNLQLDCIPLDREDVVLDCGCGPGRVAIQAAKRVKKVICLDSSEGMLAECRKNCDAAGVSNVEFVLADWQEAEAGRDFPNVDIIIQSRGGGGPTSLEKLRRSAGKYAVSILWAEGASGIPESIQKLFKDCYSEQDMEKYPELRPFKRAGGPPPRGGNGRLFGGRGDVDFSDKLPMGGKALWAALDKAGVPYTVKTVQEGWDKQYATKQEAYDDLIRLSKHPELVEQEKFRENVDGFLSKDEDGWKFFLPTASDVTVYRLH